MVGILHLKILTWNHVNILLFIASGDFKFWPLISVTFEYRIFRLTCATFPLQLFCHDELLKDRFQSFRCLGLRKRDLHSFKNLIYNIYLLIISIQVSIIPRKCLLGYWSRRISHFSKLLSTCLCTFWTISAVPIACSNVLQDPRWLPSYSLTGGEGLEDTNFGLFRNFSPNFGMIWLSHKILVCFEFLDPSISSTAAFWMIKKSTYFADLSLSFSTFPIYFLYQNVDCSVNPILETNANWFISIALKVFKISSLLITFHLHFSAHVELFNLCFELLRQILVCFEFLRQILEWFHFRTKLWYVSNFSAKFWTDLTFAPNFGMFRV